MSINELKLAYNRFGKPYLKNRRFYFNISHAHGITLCAFSRDREVGIDVEFMHAGINFLEIAERFFSDNEYKELCNVSTKDRLGAFYQCWTQKEAYIKAIGKGFRTPLDSFSVPIQNKLTLLQTKNLSEIDCWTLSPIHLIYKKHVAALAYNGINCQIRIFKYGTKLNKEIRGY
jgi:4'-phosphopantetheinyl transferase